VIDRDPPQSPLDILERRRRRGGRPRLFLLAAAIQRYMDSLLQRKPKPRPNTIKMLRSRCGTLLDGLGPQCVLSRLTFKQAQSHFEERRKTCEASTVNPEITLLRQLLLTAVSAGDIAPTPLSEQLKDLVEALPETKPDIFSREEFHKLLRVANDGKDDPKVYTRTALCLLIAHESGMRLSEILHILKSNLDFNEGFIYVRNLKDIDWTVKRGKERDVPISPYLVPRLRAYLEAQDSSARWLFPGATPLRPVTESVLSRSIKAAFDAAGFGERHRTGAHMLRRTWGSSHAKEKTPLITLCEMAGWKDLKTARVYFSVSRSDMKEAVEKHHKAREAKQAPAPSAASINLADVDALVAQGLSLEAAVTFLRKQLDGRS